MELNVCSRRVHDGYATIRARGRSRPRAVYRSDSEELLKEAGGPYTLPQIFNNPLAPEQIHQIPRWSNSGTNKILENYGTLRRGKKSLDTSFQDPGEQRIVLNTFVSNKCQLDRHREVKSPDKELNDRLYDTVPPEDSRDDAKLHKSPLDISQSPAVSLESSDNLYDTVPEETTKRIARRKSEGLSSTNHDELAHTNKPKPSRQPIYAVPSIPRSSSDTKFDSRLRTDGNYVPSGDLYRTTARYIEDINRNIAEIDKSYEELQCSSTSNARNPAYGVINKVSRSIQDQFRDQSSNDDHLYSGFHRKRDTLAPMPPISPNFGENGDDRLPGTPLTPKSGRDDEGNEGSFRFDFKIPRNPSGDFSRESIRIRPNSYGKLPPKLLPRSSSIENNSSRHSTGSTTTSSSTKSTESLYAISETLMELPKQQSTLQSNNNDRNCQYAKKCEGYAANSAFDDVFVTLRSSRRKKSSSSGTMEEDLRSICQAGATIRRNRCFNRTSDESERSVCYAERNSGKINCCNSRSNASDSTTLREKDQSSSLLHVSSETRVECYADTNTNSTSAQSRSSRQSRYVDLHAKGDSNERSNAKTIISGHGQVKSKDRSRLASSNSTGTIRRSRCSSRNDDYENEDDNNIDNDEETSLIGKKKGERRIRITSHGQYGTTKESQEPKRRHSMRKITHIEADVVIENTYQERRYGTLPYRRSRNSTRPLHKSSEDVLDGERILGDDQASTLQRSCMSTLDVRGQNDKNRARRNVDFDPIYLMDATEVILAGQLERTIRQDRLLKQEILENEERGTSPQNKSANSNFSQEGGSFNEKLTKNRSVRTRHNSLESEDLDTGGKSYGGMSGLCGMDTSPGGFATLPRRGNVSKDQRVNDTPRRLSGNVPVLEPLYEHAVSDPVKPRGNENNVIPWWELATRKYRHRSCPALQVKFSELRLIE